MKILLVSFISSLSLATSTLAQETATKELLSTKSVQQNAKWAQKWWKKRHNEKIKHKKQLGDVKLVFIGDSITHAWDDKGKEVWQQHFSKYNALNLGFSADRTEHVLWRLQNGAIDDIKPKLFVVMIGTNNAGHRKEASKDTAQGIKAILELLKQKHPQAKTLLLGIFPRGATMDDPLRKLTDGTNTIIKNFANDKSVLYLDINHKFLNEDGTLSKKVMPDLLHPAKAQYKVWAEAIIPNIEKLMNKP